MDRSFRRRSEGGLPKYAVDRWADAELSASAHRHFFAGDASSCDLTAGKPNAVGCSDHGEPIDLKDGIVIAIVPGMMNVQTSYPCLCGRSRKLSPVSPRMVTSC